MPLHNNPTKLLPSNTTLEEAHNIMLHKYQDDVDFDAYQKMIIEEFDKLNAELNACKYKDEEE